MGDSSPERAIRMPHASCRRDTVNRSRVVLIGTLAVALIGFGVVASPSSPVTAEASLQYWEGKVTSVADGDTLWVNIKGDGTSKSFEVRNAGIQATEIAHPKNGTNKDECHSREAADRMTELVFAENRHVRLSAYSASSKAGSRLLRFVDVDVAPGPAVEWVDVQEVLLREGYVWWKPNATEPAHNGDYHLAAAPAMRAGLRIYDPNYRLGRCAKGPQQGLPITVSLQYNGFHPTLGNRVNSEWIKIHNGGDKALSLGRWVVRSGGHEAPFTFPSGATVKPGGSVLVRAGKGSAANRTFYWGRSTNPFPDPKYGTAYPGRAVYLLDPDGDIRGFTAYPCVDGCNDPLRSRVKISDVRWNANGDDSKNPNGEWVEIRSTSGTVNLSGYVLERMPYNKVLPAGTILSPGDKLLVKMGQGSTDLSGSTLVVHLGADHGILSNSGQKVVLRSLTDVRLDCHSWGKYSC